MTGYGMAIQGFSLRSMSDNGEAIIGRRQPCLLDIFSQQMVDEG